MVTDVNSAPAEESSHALGPFDVTEDSVPSLPKLSIHVSMPGAAAASPAATAAADGGSPAPASPAQPPEPPAKSTTGEVFALSLPPLGTPPENPVDKTLVLAAPQIDIGSPEIANGLATTITPMATAHAASQPARISLAVADDVHRAVASRLADDAADLARPDVQAYGVNVVTHTYR